MQQLLQRRAEAAELEAQRLGALLADAEGRRSGCATSSRKCRRSCSRTTPIAALTRRQLLAANVKSPK